MAISKTKLIGVDKVSKNLQRQILGIKNRSIAGLLEAGLFLKGEAQTKTPVDTGHLRSSAYAEVSHLSTSTRPVVVVGYTAFYAPFVHEKPGKLKGLPRAGGRGRYWDPQSTATPQFLRFAMTGNAQKILSIIKRNARIPR